jgi:hypothetical protein
MAEGQGRIQIETIYDPSIPPDVLAALQQLARDVAELRRRLDAAAIP